MDGSPSRAPQTLGANYLRGFLMGGADVVPGVSGGTVALILGIYERLITAIRAVATVPVRLVRGDRGGAGAAWREVEWSLVLPLAAGILTAIGVGSVVLPPLLEEHPAQMNALFFGLVAASLAVPWRRIARITGLHLALAAAAAVAAFLLVGLPQASVEDPGLVRVALSASVAINAMILPGISGAYLLKVLGIYETTLQSVRDLDVVYIAVFGLGAAVGLGLFAKLLEWLLANRHDATMAVLVGLMAGALRALWPWQDADRGLQAPVVDGSLVGILALAALGFAAVTLLVWAGARRERLEPVDADRRPG